MNLSYHDAKYADLYEETIYNALLGALDLDAMNFYYDNPLTGSQPRGSWHVCPCCVGNIPRILLMIPTWTYVKSADGIYINLYIGSTIKVEKVAGTDIEMVQKTDYPWSGNVSITAKAENGYVAIKRTWQSGDKVEIQIPMPRIQAGRQYGLIGKHSPRRGIKMKEEIRI